MNDCKHKFFEGSCMVCWWKIGNGISVKGSPKRGDEGTEKHTKDCLTIAIAVGEHSVGELK